MIPRSCGQETKQGDQSDRSARWYEKKVSDHFIAFDYFDIINEINSNIIFAGFVNKHKLAQPLS